MDIFNCDLTLETMLSLWRVACFFSSSLELADDTELLKEVLRINTFECSWRCPFLVSTDVACERLSAMPGAS